MSSAGPAFLQSLKRGDCVGVWGTLAPVFAERCASWTESGIAIKELGASTPISESDLSVIILNSPSSDELR
jgi:hypothetical protein